MTHPGRPPYGLHIPVELDHVRDGDTLVVRRLGSNWEWAVRLLDCWAPERNTKKGKAATEYLKRIIENEELSLFIPFSGVDRSLMELCSFDRVLGYVYTGKGDLSDQMVKAGHATATKQGQ